MRTIKIDILLETEELGDMYTIAHKIEGSIKRSFFIGPKIILIEVSTDEEEHRVGQPENSVKIV